MKYLLLVLMFLTSCLDGDAQSNGVHIGEYYTVKSGFYKGCRGWASDYYDNDVGPDSVTIRDVQCDHTSINFIKVSPSELAVPKEFK